MCGASSFFFRCAANHTIGSSQGLILPDVRELEMVLKCFIYIDGSTGYAYGLHWHCLSSDHEMCREGREGDAEHCSIEVSNRSLPSTSMDQALLVYVPCCSRDEKDSGQPALGRGR